MASTPAKASPPNPRLSRVLREAGWILFLAAGLYLTLALATYDKADPGPFFSGTGAAVANKAGALGAWLADGLLYVFGLSAWWWVALAGWGVLRLYSRVEQWDILNRRSLAVALAGFAVLLAASSTLEALRLHSMKAALPRIGMAILLAITYFLEVLVDNTTSRMNWRWMLSYVWGVGLTLSLVNLIWLHQG